MWKDVSVWSHTLANSHSPPSQQRHSLCHDQEKLTLLHFKDNFLIDFDASYSSFARPKVDSWWDHSSSNHHTSDCCRWEGVTCNEETGHVIGLDLSSSCLFGSFPSNTTLFGLHQLRELDLSDNDFNSSLIPSAVGQLSKLTTLNLSSSDFTGAVPSGVSNLSSLSILDLSSNYGLEIDATNFEKLVGNFTHLTHLYLDLVDISSTVPVTLTNLTSLRSLSLEDCNLYGDFPASILQSPTLELLNLAGNTYLEGFLPEFPFNSHLTYLGISGTSFHGKITASIGRLDRLTLLNLGDSGLTGLIPSSLGNLTKLTTLHLALNANFKHSMPLSLTNLTQIASLSLSNLNVTPEILNSWFLKLNKLDVLTLSHGILYDEIPQSIANHTRLRWLDLQSNQLTCPLPIWLANLTQLVYLDLYDNQFKVPIIPKWISKLLNLKTLALSSRGSVAMFDTLLKLTQLTSLNLIGVNLIFSLNTSTNNSSLPKIEFLQLASCNLTEFPAFLRYQDELKLLQLDQNNIVGNIPIWLVNTTSKNLKEINLSNNILQGFEQPDSFLSWRHLEIFNISNNNLQGQLVATPNSLLIYDASQNHLSGDLPKQICKASSLICFDVSANNLSGRIPTCFGTQLSASSDILNLRDNHLEGFIPQTFTSTCKLKMIDLSMNQLEGELPKSLTNCRFLEVLDVGKNNLRGIFPSWLGGLPKLQALVLRENNFNGEITTLDSDHAFSCLRIIDLSNNFHTGNLPSFYIQNWLAMRISDEDDPSSSAYSSIGVSIQTASLQRDNVYHPYFYKITITIKGSETLLPRILNVFRVIDFSSNNFTGGIPDILGSLRGLQALNLSNNQLSGEIPSSLANLIDLEALDLSQNMLTGVVPHQFNKMTFLEIFNVSYNHLEGLIPQGQQFDTFDNSSFDGNSALCGAPLSKKCENTTDWVPSHMTEDETEEDSKLIDWIIRCLGCVSGCIVGFIIGKIFITDPRHDWFMDTFGRRQMSKTRAKRSAPSRRRH